MLNKFVVDVEVEQPAVVELNENEDWLFLGAEGQAVVRDIVNPSNKVAQHTKQSEAKNSAKQRTISAAYEKAFGFYVVPGVDVSPAVKLDFIIRTQKTRQTLDPWAKNLPKRWQEQLSETLAKAYTETFPLFFGGAGAVEVQLRNFFKRLDGTHKDQKMRSRDCISKKEAEKLEVDRVRRSDVEERAERRRTEDQRHELALLQAREDRLEREASRQLDREHAAARDQMMWAMLMHSPAAPLKLPAMKTLHSSSERPATNSDRPATNSDGKRPR